MRAIRLIGLPILAIVVWAGFSKLTHEPPAITRPALPERMPEATEVAFVNDGIPLAGQLFLPKGTPRAALVIIHGSGTSSRSNGWYGTLTAELVSRGFAVLLPDKRGSERSGGDWSGVSMEELAGDTAAAVALLKDHLPGIRTGVIGVSQGGWVAAVLAARDPGLAFAVNLSGASVRPSEQLVLEERNTMRDEFGLPDALARVLAPLTAWNIRHNVQPQLWASLDHFYANDYWARTSIPVFIAYGELDELDNVPVAESVRRIRAMGKENITIKVYPAVGHGLFDHLTGIMAAAFLDDLEAFVSTSAGKG